MRTPHVPKEFQEAIRGYWDSRDVWPQLADDLGITLKSVQHMLDPKSPREVTYHFCGLLATLMPFTWTQITRTIKTEELPQGKHRRFRVIGGVE